MRNLRLAAAAWAVVGGLVTTPASAGPAGNTAAVFVPFTYAPDPVHLPHGEGLTFANLDPLSGEGHSLTQAVPKGTEQFQSPILPPGSTAPVKGVEGLAPGTYPFTCRIHPFMTGTLVVE